MNETAQELSTVAEGLAMHWSQCASNAARVAREVQRHGWRQLRPARNYRK